MLCPDGRASMVFFYYDLPKKGKIGAWLRVKGRIRICGKGFHFCRTAAEVKYWGGLGNNVWLVELDGAVLSGKNKGVAQRIRLVRKIGTITRARHESWNGYYLKDSEKPTHPSNWLRTVEHQVKKARELGLI